MSIHRICNFESHKHIIIICICILNMLGTLCAQHPYERKWLLGGARLSSESAYSRMNIIEFNHENTLIYTQDSRPTVAV
ncbi:hypothetical protein BH23THE1_BH23THE1_36450 [soil metagenome]